jgi:hypothetical protein
MGLEDSQLQFNDEKARIQLGEKSEYGCLQRRFNRVGNFTQRRWMNESKMRGSFRGHLSSEE